MKKISYWIDHTADEEKRKELVKQFRKLKREIHTIHAIHRRIRSLPFVRYADDWLVGVCGTKEECIALKAEIANFLSRELKLTLSEEKTLITHSSEKVRFIGYDIYVRRSQEIKGYKMKNGKWRKSRSLHFKIALLRFLIRGKDREIFVCEESHYSDEWWRTEI